jgi:acetylornithine/succinyldiaminopimelate/putrescine aminotransferase
MSNIRDLYINHVAQTSDFSMLLPIEKAEGMYIYDTDGKAYLDFNSGISVSSLGHRHPTVIKAIKDQLDKHMHTMVYGEHIHLPQVKYASLLANTLNNGLDSVYFVNSGSEAVEVALKLAKKHTERYEIIACSNAYHGSTIGAESLRSDTEFTSYFCPAIPGIRHIDFNNFEQLDKITSKTAAVICEPVQAESGLNPPKDDYLKAIRKKCNETGTLFILDEIQTGFGRTGHLFAHQKYDVIPDILLIAKSMGGGMPIGAVVAPKSIMNSIAIKPALGHITTFGGHPVVVASALATLETLLNEDIVEKVSENERLIHKKLKHPIIKEIRSSGLMMAVELTKRKYLKHVVSKAIENGVLIDYFLFNDRSFRLAPPLILEAKHIDEGVEKLMKAMDYAAAYYE